MPSSKASTDGLHDELLNETIFTSLTYAREWPTRAQARLEYQESDGAAEIDRYASAGLRPRVVRQWGRWDQSFSVFEPAATSDVTKNGEGQAERPPAKIATIPGGQRRTRAANDRLTSLSEYRRYFVGSPDSRKIAKRMLS
jgi:hypothetical protein